MGGGGDGGRGGGVNMGRGRGWKMWKGGGGEMRGEEDKHILFSNNFTKTTICAGNAM